MFLLKTASTKQIKIFWDDFFYFKINILLKGTVSRKSWQEGYGALV
jgi:hypothetical protein